MKAVENICASCGERLIRVERHGEPEVYVYLCNNPQCQEEYFCRIGSGKITRGLTVIGGYR